MGYRIIYRPVKKLRQQYRNRSRRAALTGLALMAFFWVVGSFWEEGRAVLHQFVSPTGMVVNAVARLREIVKNCLVEWY